MGKRWVTLKDGRRVLIDSNRGATAVAAAVLAGGVAVAGGGIGGAGTAGTAADAASQALRAKTTNSKSAARKGQRGEAWRRLGLKRLKNDVEHAVECAVHSYGQVREFFLHTPCRSLDRNLLLLGDGQGGTFVLSIAWVRMRGSAAADRLQDLADTDGTGNVAPIGSIGPQLGDVRFTGDHYDSGRRRAVTVIAEAAPSSGDPDGELMQAATEVAVLLPSR